MGIRKKMLPHWVDIVSRDWPKWLRDLMMASAEVADLICDKVLVHVSRALSEGNAFVFNEIGGTFSRFGQFFAAQSAIGPDEKLLARFLDTLDPSSQALLIQGFTYYYRLMWEVENRTQLLYYSRTAQSSQ